MAKETLVKNKFGGRTPLTVEMLLWAIEQHCMTIAGFNGSCERVIRYDSFVEALKSLSQGSNKIKLREHRGNLADSFSTIIEIEPTYDALLNAIRDALTPYGVTVDIKQIKVVLYGFDERTGWDTYIVTVDGYGVFGFTNGPLNKPDNKNIKKKRRQGNNG